MRAGRHLLLIDFQNTYNRSFLGYFWSFVKPFALVYPFLLMNREFKFLPKDLPCSPSVFMLVSSIYWQFFSDAMQAPLMFSQRYRKELLLRPRFEYVAVSAGVWSAFGGLFFRIVPAIIWLAVLGTLSLPGALLSFVLLIPLALFALCFVLPAISLNVIYNDIRLAMGYLMGFLLWSSAVFYLPESNSIFSKVTKLNPISILIGSCRELLLGLPANFFNGASLFSAIVFIAAVFSLSYTFFKRNLRSSLDYVI